MAHTDSWNPEQYDKFKVQRSQPFYDLMQLLEPTSGASVFDLGCGTGELTSELHQFLKAKETLGIDASAETLKKAAAFEKADIHFAQGNIETWSAPQSSDVIFSNAAIQWCKDHPLIFKMLKVNLKAGGQLAVQMPMNHDYPTHLIAREMSAQKPWAGLLREPYRRQDAMLTVEDYATLLFQLGFKDQKVLLKVYGHHLDSRESVIEWIKGTLLTYFQSRLSANDFEDFVDEFSERLFKQLPDDKPFFYPFKRVLIWARA